MKTIITPVGTSLFTNFLESPKGSGSIETYLKSLQGEPSDRWKEYKDDEVNEIRSSNVLQNWMDSQGLKASAELYSLDQITGQIEEHKNRPHRARLIASDTVLSRLAAEIVSSRKDELEQITFQHNSEQDTIKHLDVNRNDQFKQGLSNLIRRIRTLNKDYDLVMNLTAGYKATLPYLSMYGFINDIPCYYSFEEAPAVLEIPQLPTSFDLSFFKEHREQFKEIEEREIVEDANEFINRDYEFYQQAKPFLERDRDENWLSFSALGEMFWERVSKNTYQLYTDDKTYKKIQSSEPLLRILREKFWNEPRKESMTEKKNGHRVWDDGDNQRRIFYFKEGERTYVYKVFEDHDKYELYLENNSFSDQLKQEVKKDSSRRSISISR